MCGRYTLTSAAEQLAERFGISVDELSDEELVARYNVAPSQMVPIVVETPTGRVLRAARWGFRPAWSTGTRPPPINARAETLAEGRLFRDALTRGRCLVPADGFYEWQAVPGRRRRQPHFLHLKSGELFAFAGLYTSGNDETGDPPTVAIITVPANSLVAAIHHRMPAILSPQDEGRWLDLSRDPAAGVEAARCLREYDPEAMEAHPVAPLVSDTRLDGPDLVRSSQLELP